MKKVELRPCISDSLKAKRPLKEQLSSLFEQAISELKNAGVIPADHDVTIKFERTRQKEHGDFATNLAMTLAKPSRRNPRELAELIVAKLPEHQVIVKTEIAGPGFINIFVAQDARQGVINQVLERGDAYGRAKPDSGQKIQVEFVSANPTGPLHVGHGRGAAYGDTLARLLKAAGHRVESEYYVNDAGRQMDILAVSVWFRYLQLCNIEAELPSNAYQGDYIKDMAATLFDQHGDAYTLSAEAVAAAQDGLDEEAGIDAVIALAKDGLANDGYSHFFNHALDTIRDGIKDDLHDFGVDFDVWFSERSLFTDGKIQVAIDQLKTSGHVYEKSGAWWFKSTDFGDEKDRVVIRDNGQPTYFASDIAYHKDKYDRGFDECINIWGADHHGYIARVKAALSALDLDPDKLRILLVQFAVLWRGEEKVKMSTRSGQFVTLEELRKDIGKDAARFFYAQRKSEQHMDFDLELAKSQSNENPVYYVQYAHARICSVFSQAQERDIATDTQDADLSLLASEHEQTLMGLIERFPEVVSKAAASYEPHQVSYYLRDIATAFHSWYNASNFLNAETEPRVAMLALCAAVKQVIANGLFILGVTPAEKM